MKPAVDLNADLGEGGGNDAAVMPWITSANIGCGGHAGDEATMRATVALAQAHGVAIGAHPGYADREHFGRRELDLSLAAVAVQVREQIEALARLAPVRHVKLHGALYHRAAHESAMAATIAEVVRMAGRERVLYAPPGSELVRAGRTAGLTVAEEVFADRAYRRDGSLVPRGQPGAMIDEETMAAAQVLRMLREGVVRTVEGEEMRIAADTVCVHGDGARAAMLAKRLREALAAAGVAVRAFGG